MKIQVHFFTTARGFGFGLTPDMAVTAYREANNVSKRDLSEVMRGGAERGYVMIRIPAGAIEVDATEMGGVRWKMPEGMAPGKPDRMRCDSGKWEVI